MVLSVTEVLEPWTNYDKVNPALLKIAAQRGKDLHKAYAEYAKDPGQTDFIRGYLAYHERKMDYYQPLIPCFDQFKDWFDQWVKKVLFVEKEFYDQKYDIKGHPDLVCILASNETAVVDYKNIQAKQKTWGAQLAAYRRLVMGHVKTTKIRRLVIRMHPKHKRALVNEYSDDYRDFEGFKAALNAYRYFKGE